MMPDPHTRLLAALDARLERARAARGESWEQGTDGWIYGAASADVIWTPPGETNTPRAVGTFLLANDPATEIRRVEALRRVVERHAPFWGTTPYSPNHETLRVLKCSACGMWTNMGEDHEDWPCADIRDLAAGEGIEVGDA